MSDWDNVAHDLAVGIDVVVRCRDTPLIRQYLKAFHNTESLKMDGDALRDEIRSVLASIRFKPFALEGLDGIKEANEARFAIRAARDRIVAINGSLRDVLFDLQKRYRLAKVWLRANEPDVSKLTIKESEDVVSVIISEVHDKLEEVKNLMAETADAFVEFNDKARVVDSWMTLHKEFAFHNGNRRYGNDETPEDTQPPGRKLSTGRR